MTAHQKNLSLAVVCCVLAFFFNAAMGACNKLISHSVSIFTILLFQNAICFLLTLPQVIWNRCSLKTEKWGLHLSRDLIGMAAFFFIFLALRSLPLVDGMLLQNTAPLWIPLIAFVWLGIRMRRNLWWGIIAGFIGIILILKPGTEALSIGAIYSIASGIGSAICMLLVSRLSHTEPVERILFYYFLLGTILSALISLFTFSIPSSKDLVYLAGVGMCAFLANILMTYTFRHGKVSVLAPITYCVVIFSGMFDYLIWNHIPDLLSFLGIILVTAGSLLSIYFEKQYQKLEAISEKP